MTGALSVVEALLGVGADMSAPCEHGATALHHAAEAGRVEVLARLLTVADRSLIRRQDATGWAPLHSAARHAAPDCVRSLLEVRMADRSTRIPV